MVGHHDAGHVADSGSATGDTSLDTNVMTMHDAFRVDTNPSPEVCDGIDNDGNGIIDDVDVGHDGVCDCLRPRRSA